MGGLSRRGHHGNGPTSEGATAAERANTMIGLQIMMPAGSWPPVSVRASSRHIRSWGDSGHAGHIGGTAALDPYLKPAVHRSIQANVDLSGDRQAEDPECPHEDPGRRPGDYRRRDVLCPATPPD